MKTLQEIGLFYGTDKSTYHKFCDFYEKFLHHIRDEKISLLEIGILKGNSLLMWNEYFHNGFIYGIDIYPKNVNVERIKTSICDQSKREDLKNIFIDVPFFDIIIDDGGHEMNQQQISLGVLFKRLKNNGIYIIEDLHTSLQEKYRNGDTFENSTLYLIEEYKKTRTFNSKFLSQEEIDYLINNIKDIEIYKVSDSSITSVIIKK